MEDAAQSVKKHFSVHSKFYTVLISILLVVIATVSFWITNNIYNSQKFAERVTTSVTSEQARNIIANDITDKLYGDHPVAQQLVGERTTALVSSLLNTSQFRGILYNFAQKFNRVITTSDYQPITIDVSGFVNPLNALVGAVAPDSNLNLKLDDVNTEITLLDNKDIPNYKTIGQVLLILGPLSILGLLVTMIVAWRKNQRSGYHYLSGIGTVLLVSSVIIFVITYTSGALLTLNIIDPDRSQLMSIIYDSFITNLRIYIYSMFLVGLIIKIIGEYKIGNMKKFAKSFNTEK